MSIGKGLFLFVVLIAGMSTVGNNIDVLQSAFGKGPGAFVCVLLNVALIYMVSKFATRRQ